MDILVCEIWATMHVLHDNSGVISNLIRNFQLFNVIENIMIALGEQDEHHGYRFCWFWGSLHTLFGYDAFNTSKIHSKFILRQKSIILIVLIVSHTPL